MDRPLLASTLASTLPLLRWLQTDPAWPGLPLGQRAGLGWQARLGSLNHRLARLNAGPTAADLPAPLLVLGPWRSGTTVMHELLAAATGLSTPRTWQCMNAAAFTSSGRPAGKGVRVLRPMDGLAVSADSPQEDEFALLTLGVDSAYRAFWMPHRLAQLQHTLQPEHWLQDESWLATWLGFLADVQRSAPGRPGPVLLKSPNHSFRLAAIQRRFPATRAVWMLRDGSEVFHSNLKMWRAMFLQHGLTEAAPQALEAFLAQALWSCAQVLDSSHEAIRRGLLLPVQQQQLRDQGLQTVRALYPKLQLAHAIDDSALAAAFTATGGVTEAAYPPEVPAAAQAAVQAFDAAQARAWALTAT